MDIDDGHAIKTRARAIRRQRFILAAILFLVAAVFSFAGRLVVSGYADYREMLVVRDAEQLKEIIISFTAALARERGWTMALLGLPPDDRQALWASLKETRETVDTKWRELNMQLHQDYFNDASLADGAIDLNEAYLQLTALRHRIDTPESKMPVGFAEWYQTSTATIDASRAVWQALPIPLPQELITVSRYRQLREASWDLSEYSGRERGLLAYFISAHRPPPKKVMEELHYLALEIDEQSARIDRMLESGALPEKLLHAVNRMKEEYLGRFTNERQRVRQALPDGSYPLSGSEWVTRATFAIDSVVDVSGAVSGLVRDALYPIVARTRRDLIVGLLILISVCVTAVCVALRISRMVAELFERQRLAEITLGTIGDGVITTDARGRIEFLNVAAESMTGWTLGEARGELFERIFPLHNRYTMEPRSSAMSACLDSGQVETGSNDSLLVRRDGTEVAVFHTSAPIYDTDSSLAGTVTVFYDLLNTWSEQHLLSYHGTHDTLTGLINRTEFERCIHAAVSRSADVGEQYALCYLDIDQFKVINDICGHPAGDLMIKELVGVLKQHLRDTDPFARLGGDEFGLLLQKYSPQRALEVAENLRREVEDFRFNCDGHIFCVSLSIGIVPITGAGQTSAQLLAIADAACFAAKEKGRNQIHLYEPDDPELAKRHSDMMWITRLRRAVEEDDFELYCQPIVSVSDRAPFAIEILVRLHQPGTVVVAPGAFIPAAERYGIMASIDRWVVTHTFEHFAACSVADTDLLISINLSGASLGNPATAEFIQQQFKTHHIAPERICFEITETATIGNFKVAYQLLNELRANGCKIALDDFGTGLSSFAYLRDLPIDFIKMGGGFVRNMPADKKHAAMVEATHAAARAMNLPMIAESMENRGIESMLKSMGIEYMQGYGIARPMLLQEYCNKLKAEKLLNGTG